MKIGNSNTNTLITSTETSGSKFKIQATGKAFSILSNALYQHKVKAVVREIGCNAFDAHIDAGNTQTPFNVSLPCKEDPHFKVRDFGIGLAEDKFVEVYTTYFGSSKADSNDHTGGLGLGSKTPFIMSKTFTVHSFYEGIDYMWHSYVNDNGEPDVVLLHKKETTESNGLLVIVPIGQGQSETEQNALFREFQAEAQTIYQWFDVLPNVTCGGKNVALKRKLDTTGKYGSLKLTGMDNTTVYFEKDHSKSSQSETVLVKMGNVVYPYNLKEVKSLDRFGGAVGHAERMVKYLTMTGRLNAKESPLVIDVGMGDVDIAPSREALSLSNTTELTIINALVRFTDMFFDKIQHTIDHAKTTFEKYEALFAVPPIGGRKFTLDGKEIDPHAQNPVWAFGSDAAMQGRNNFLRKFSAETFCVKYRRPGTRGIIPLNTSFDMTMYGPGTKDRNVILIDKAYKGELRLWVNANTKAESSVVVVFGREYKGGQWVPCPMTDVEMAPFLEDNHPQVVKFSDLKSVPVITPRSSQAASLKVSDDSMLVMGRMSEYNFFTQGNASLEHLNKFKPFNASTDKIETVYVCYQRQAGKIYAELQDTTDGKNVIMSEIAPWSRAQSSSGSYSYECSAAYGLFETFVYNINKVTHAKMTINHGGKKYDVKKVKHVVLNKEGYSAVVGNSDYPQFLSVDEAIKKLIIPLVPVDFHTYTVSNRNMYIPARADGVATLFKLLRLDEYRKFQADLETKVGNANNGVIRGFEGNMWVMKRHYAQHKKTGTVTHDYDFSEPAFKSAVIAAKTAGIKGADELLLMLNLSKYSIRDILYSYRHSEAAEWVANMFAARLQAVGFDYVAFDQFMVDYTEKTHKKS